MRSLMELDERVSDGLVVRLMYWDGENGLGDPVTLIQVYEGQDATEPALAYETPPESAREAFLHPYGYAP